MLLKDVGNRKKSGAPNGLKYEIYEDGVNSILTATDLKHKIFERFPLFIRSRHLNYIIDHAP